MNTEEDYQPYGHDWETEMMKWNKRHLVDWVRRLLTSQEQDYFESLTDQLKQRDETIKQLKEALKVCSNELFSLMEHCVDRGYLDLEDKTQGIQDYEKAMETARKLLTE